MADKPKQLSLTEMIQLAEKINYWWKGGNITSSYFPAYDDTPEHLKEGIGFLKGFYGSNSSCPGEKLYENIYMVVYKRSKGIIRKKRFLGIGAAMGPGEVFFKFDLMKNLGFCEVSENDSRANEIQEIYNIATTKELEMKREKQEKNSIERSNLLRKTRELLVE